MPSDRNCAVVPTELLAEATAMPTRTLEFIVTVCVPVVVQVTPSVLEKAVKMFPARLRRTQTFGKAGVPDLMFVEEPPVLVR